MKIAVASLTIFLAVATSQAGSFGGPGPFRNDSPLPTGVDGSYQASARGSNLSGVFRFTYVDGNQSTNPDFSIGNVLVDPYNDYVFFVDGIVYRGLVQANINGSSVAGVLDNGSAYIPNINTTYSSILSFMSGFYNGNAKTNSPNFNFNGNGHVYTWNVDTTTSTFFEVGQRDFKFSGIRNSIQTSTTN